MAGISIDWTALEMAFESHDPSVESWLVRKSGEVITVAPGAEAEKERFENVPKDELLAIEPVPSREQYRMMERFIETVTHPHLRERLQDSIVGKGAFRRFKDVVGRFPEERKRWFAFRDALLHRHILDWLSLHKIDLTEMPAWNLEPPMTPSTNVSELEEGALASGEGAPVEEKQEATELRVYLLSWARAHAEEYHYLFGPAAFERLALDILQEFTLFRRRPGGGKT